MITNPIFVMKEENENTSEDKTEKKSISGKERMVKEELKSRSSSFSDKKTQRKHSAPKTGRNPKGFS